MTVLVVSLDPAAGDAVERFSEFAETPVEFVQDCTEAARALHTNRGRFEVVIFAVGAETDTHQVEDIHACMDAVDELSLGFILVGAESVPLDMGQLNSGCAAVLRTPLRYNQWRAAVREAKWQARDTRPDDGFRIAKRLIGESEAICNLREGVLHHASAEKSLVVLGEPGTDRLGLAQTIHAASTRRSGPFVPLNCRALDAKVVERELFGTADDDGEVSPVKTVGRMQLAAGGTLFLDGINALPPSLRQSIVCAVRDDAVESTRTLRLDDVDIRLIMGWETQPGSDAHALDDELEGVDVLTLAPLRERPADIPYLWNRFCQDVVEDDRPYVELSKQAMSMLQAYPWRRNERELKQLFERLCLDFPNQVVDVEGLPFSADDLLPAARVVEQPANQSVAPPPQQAATQAVAQVPGQALHQAAQPASVTDSESAASAEADLGLDPSMPFVQWRDEGIVDLKGSLAAFETAVINWAVDYNQGVVSAAARSVGLNRTTLIEKMRKYDLSRRRNS